MIYADAIAKHKKIPLLTGTDEHGLKVFQSAKGQPILQYCDTISNKFRYLADNFINYDQFIRTTNQNHIKNVQEKWQILQNNDYIYKDLYKGYYCQIEEAFVQHKTEQYLEEENYFFKLNKEYVTQLIDNAPQRYKNELKSLILEKICVSRPITRQQWGIQVPNDPKQYIYVWLDALFGYYQGEGTHYIHVLGKDIVKFHMIYWPSFLKGINDNSTQEFIVHNHWIRDKMKMSKSLGNVIDPMILLKQYSSQQIRLYFLTQGPQNYDVSFDEQQLKLCWDNYVDQFNNILVRLFRPKVIKPNQLIYKPELLNEESNNFIVEFYKLQNKVLTNLNISQFVEAYSELQKIFLLINNFIDKNTPWKIQDHQKKEQILSLCCITISITQGLLKIFIQTPNIISPEFNFIPNIETQITVNTQLDLKLSKFIK